MAFQGTWAGTVSRIGATLFLGGWLATGAFAQSGEGSGSGLVGSGGAMTRAGVQTGNSASTSHNDRPADGQKDQANDPTSTSRVGVSPSTNTE